MKYIDNSNKGGDTQTSKDNTNLERGTLFEYNRTKLALSALVTQSYYAAAYETASKEQQNGRKTMKHEQLNIKRMKTKCCAISLKNALLGAIMAILLLVGSPIALASLNTASHVMGMIPDDTSQPNRCKYIKSLHKDDKIAEVISNFQNINIAHTSGSIGLEIFKSNFTNCLASRFERAA